MRKISLALLVCTLLFYGSCTNIARATSLGIASYSLSDEEKEAIINKANMQVIQTDNTKMGIQCFDVKQDGTVAIGIGTGSDCMIYVYDPSGVFQYGYHFRSDGDYGIVFQDDMIGIFFIRGNTISFYNSSGICVDVQKVSNPSQDHAHLKKILTRTEKVVAQKRYVLERDFDIGDSYSRFVVFDEYGERTVLYDTTNEQKAVQVLSVCVISCFFAAVGWGCIKKLKAEESE